MCMRMPYQGRKHTVTHQIDDDHSTSWNLIQAHVLEIIHKNVFSHDIRIADKTVNL